MRGVNIWVLFFLLSMPTLGAKAPALGIVIADEERKALVAWLGESDPDLQNRRWAAKGPFPPVPADKKMEELNKALKYAQMPIEEDPRLIRFRKDLEISARQAKNPRLTAAQDLTWALINNPSFLFNH